MGFLLVSTEAVNDHTQSTQRLVDIACLFKSFTNTCRCFLPLGTSQIYKVQLGSSEAGIAISDQLALDVECIHCVRSGRFSIHKCLTNMPASNTLVQ